MSLKNYKKIKNSKNIVFYPKKKNKFYEVNSKLIQSIKTCAKKYKKKCFFMSTHLPKR